MRLDQAREALERAGRLLDELSSNEGVTSFRDTVPYVLAQLHLITGLITLRAI